MDEIPPPEAFEPQPDGLAGAGRLRRRVRIAVTLILVAALVTLAAIEGSGFIIRGDRGNGVDPGPVLPSAPMAARLAAVDSAGSLTTMDGSGASVTAYAVPGVAFQFPAWSPDGTRIAAIGQGADGTGIYVFTARVVEASPADPVVVYRSADRPPFYLYWTPDGRRLTFLTTEPDGLALRIAPADGSADASIVRAGAPIYWDFVDSSRLLVHSGAAGPDAFLGEVGIDGTTLQPSEAVPGLFRPPAVSADGGFRAYATGGPGSSGDVVVEADDGSLAHRIRVFGPAAISFGPGGHELAFVAPGGANGRALTLPIGPLRIVGTDLAEPRTLVVGNVVGFFWSPSGTEIAVLRLDTSDPDVNQAGGGGGVVLAAAGRTVAAAPGQPLRLLFVNVADASVQSERTVRVSDLLVNQVLPFFDQYALSHRFWSPDGAAVVLPVVGDDGATRLVRLPSDGSEAQAIATGEMASWSP